MSSNVHNLLHLPKMVEDLGALWAHSCFPFESAIGELLKLFHGSQGIEKQVTCVCVCVCNGACLLSHSGC